MSQFLPDDHGPVDRLPDTFSEFEQQLRKAPTSAGPAAQRRDRLMYDSGFAAALAQFEVQLQTQKSQSRQSLSQWKFLSLAMSVLLVASVGLHAFYGPARPSSLAVVDETTEESPVQKTESSPPQVWPGMAPGVADAKPRHDDSSRVTSVRSQWTDYELAPLPMPDSQNTPPAHSIELPLRATDYRRLLDRT
jgi:hypothetical protein